MPSSDKVKGIGSDVVLNLNRANTVQNQAHSVNPRVPLH